MPDSGDTILVVSQYRAYYTSVAGFWEQRYGRVGSGCPTVPLSATSFAIIDNVRALRSYKLKVNNHSGDVVHNLQDRSGHYHTITSVNEADGCLWRGSLIQPRAARIPVPQAR